MRCGPGKRRYWIKGVWANTFGEAIAYADSVAMGGRPPNVWRIHDGWNPENGATLVSRCATYVGVA